AQASDAALLEQVRAWQPPTTQQLISEVTTDAGYEVTADNPVATVGILDLGVRQATISQLVERGNTVKVFPADTSFETLTAANLDGIILSSGPGDPAAATAQVELA